MEVAIADQDTGLEESMCQLRMAGGGGKLPYPERPGVPDCSYYLRNGSCGFGQRCRYNHPRDRGEVAAGARVADLEYPERTGKPACQYFLKTGTCRYGMGCKYDHPRHGDGSVHLVSLNYLGYPIRLGEKDCIYYMRTGQCKFGSTCKFHHPQPVGATVPSSPHAFYPPLQSSSVHPRASMATPYIQGPYGPMLVSPGVVPIPGWTPYPHAKPASASPLVSPSRQPSIQAGALYRSSNQLSPSAPSYQGTYSALSSSAGPSSISQKEHMFPERPGEQECSFYMRTGDCKFGSTCKFHHPPERSIQRTNCVLNPIGLPIRQGAPLCAFYAQHGACKFGLSCKFDHPMVRLSYSPSASSLAEMPVAPYPVGFSMSNLAPSRSSSDLQPESLSNKDAFSTGMPSKGSHNSHSPVQISTPPSPASHQQ